MPKQSNAIQSKASHQYTREKFFFRFHFCLCLVVVGFRLLLLLSVCLSLAYQLGMGLSRRWSVSAMKISSGCCEPPWGLRRRGQPPWNAAARSGPPACASATSQAQPAKARQAVRTGSDGVKATGRCLIPFTKFMRRRSAGPVVRSSSRCGVSSRKSRVSWKVPASRNTAPASIC